MYNKTKTYLLFYLLLIVYHPIAQGYDNEKKIRIAIPENFQPYYFKDSNGDFKGASIEISRIILKKLGYKIKITQFPNMKTALKEIELGKQDLNINLTATPEREMIAKFTHTPHLHETQNIIVRSDSEISFNGSLDELISYRIGVIFGWTYGPDFDNKENLDRVYVNSSPEQLRSLLSGRFDLAINNPQFFENLAENSRTKEGFKILTPAIYSLPVKMAVSNKYSDTEGLISKLNNEILLFKRSEKYRLILNKYGFNNIDPKKESK